MGIMKARRDMVSSDEAYQNMDGNTGLSASVSPDDGSAGDGSSGAFGVISDYEAQIRQFSGAGLMVGGLVAGAFAYGQMGWMMTTGWLVYRMGTAKI